MTTDQDQLQRRPPVGLAATAAISALVGAVALAIPLIETVALAFGVLAVVAGAGAMVRSSRKDRAAQTIAALAVVGGFVVLVAVISRVDKVIIPTNPEVLERRP